MVSGVAMFSFGVLLFLGQLPLAAAYGNANGIYDATDYHTEHGCECTGKCQTSLMFSCSSQPYCTVKSSNCANGEVRSLREHQRACALSSTSRVRWLAMWGEGTPC